MRPVMVRIHDNESPASRAPWFFFTGEGDDRPGSDDPAGKTVPLEFSNSPLGTGGTAEDLIRLLHQVDKLGGKEGLVGFHSLLASFYSQGYLQGRLESDGAA